MAIGYLLLLVFGVLAPTVLVALNIGADPKDPDPISSLIGLSVGASAYSLMAINLFLAARPWFLEPLIGGLDRIYKLHKWVGVGVLGFALLHDNIDIYVRGAILAEDSAGLAVDVAETVFPLMIILILVSYFKRLPFVKNIRWLQGDLVPYYWWRMTHKLFGALFLAFSFHQVFVATPFAATSMITSYLNVMMMLGVGGFLFSQAAPFIYGKRFEIAGLRMEGGALVIDATPLWGGLRARPGGFAFISFGKSGVREPHPFTVSKAAADGSAQFSIKGLGDFTKRLPESLAVGDKMTIEGPYGRFSFTRGPKKQIWLAGGVGVTPFLAFSDVLDAAETREIVMIYCVAKPEELLGLDRLQAAASRMPNFTLHTHVSSEVGRLNAEKLIEYAPFAPREAGLWFCGPAPMRSAVLDGLKAAKQSPKSVHFEEFEFR